MSQEGKAVIAVTHGMVQGGLKILDEVTGEGAEDATDIALVTSIFVRMWQIYLAENEAIKRGKQPKVMAVKPKLVDARGNALKASLKTHTALKN